MSQQEQVYALRAMVLEKLVGLSRPQALVLAMFALGMALARRCTLGIVAEKLSFLGKADSLERRLQRFLANSHIDWQGQCRGLSRWLIESLPRQATIVLLVDETSLSEYLKVMVVAIAYHGRALPVAWWCYAQDKWPCSQVELIDTLLGWVIEGLPSGRRVMVQADRGLATSPQLLERLERRGLRYLVRVQREVRLRLEDGREVSFGELIKHPGSSFRGYVYAFKKAQWRRLWALGAWHKQAREPWLLVSNCHYPKAQDYGRRMWQEEAFRDLKSNGFGWNTSHVRTPEHANLLWLVMSLAYAYVLTHGSLCKRRPALLKLVSRGASSRHSLFRLGLRLIECWFSRSLPLQTKLYLPCPCLHLKSVV